MGQAPEGEPFFWTQPPCRPAIFPARHPARPRPRRLPPARLCPCRYPLPRRKQGGKPDEPRALQATEIGQQCCPMQNMAEPGQLHKGALILLFAAAKKGTEEALK